MPTIVLNGEPKTVQEDATVAGLLEELRLDPRQVAVERNQHIVPRAHYPTVTLEENDTVEVVTFVGGG